MPIATVPVYYSTPVYYYDTSVSFCALCGCLQTIPVFSRFRSPACLPVAFGEPLGTATKRGKGPVTGCQPRVHTVRGSFDGVEGMEAMQLWRAGMRALGCVSCVLLMGLGIGMCRPSISSLSLFTALFVCRAPPIITPSLLSSYSLLDFPRSVFSSSLTGHGT